MTDYNKQTVANLRVLLKDRGIPSTGLTRKQQIIEKLQEADNTQSAPETFDAAQQSEDPEPAEASISAGELAPASTPTVANFAITKQVSAIEGASESEPPPLTYHAPIELTEVGSELVTQTAAEDELLSEPPVTHSQSTATLPLEDTQSTLPTTTQQDSVVSSSIPPEEYQEDTRKRKRRSGSPDVATQDINKRLRQEEEGSNVILMKEDVAFNGEIVSEEKMEGGKEQTVLPMGSSDDVMQVDEAQDNGVAVNGGHVGTQEVDQQVDRPPPLEQSAEQTELKEEPEAQTEAQPEAQTEAQPEAQSEVHPEAELHAQHETRDMDYEPKPPTPSHRKSKDVRYKELFQAPVEPVHHEPPTVEDDKPLTTPSLHPATSTIYIRNFMRPLQPPALKSHLISLATPPNSSADSSMLQTFHLDQIRTHAFARFTSATAAARVRSSLHDRVWPTERDRKPLWVDFIPEEKIDEWIDIEASGGSGRGTTAKKWEVVYEDLPGGGVEAVLSEVGAGSSRRGQEAARQSISAPSGPRAEARRPSDMVHPDRMRPAVSNAPVQPEAASRTVLNLDKIFQFTTAKPKLYFQPVSKELTSRRLDELDKRTKRDWVDRDAGRQEEEHRYTFEDGDVLVDTGYHNPGRGGFRGGRGGGYGRGGGGYGRGRGGESWRGR